MHLPVHLSLLQCCLLLQTLASNLHLHGQVSCWDACLVLLILEIRFNLLKTNRKFKNVGKQEIQIIFIKMIWIKLINIWLKEQSQIKLKLLKLQVIQNIMDMIFIYDNYDEYNYYDIYDNYDGCNN